jgi:hydrogenase 3 maturation protease
MVARGLTQCRLLPDPDSVLVMDAGHAPENRTGELRRFHPDLVILIDAAEMGARPGDIRWLSIDEIDGMSASTHTMPLSMLARYLLMECGCEVKILGIQPGYTEYGEGMSGSVLQAVNEIVDGFVELWSPFPTHEYQSWN